MSLAKVGMAAVENLPRRVAEVGRCQYGGWLRGPRGYERAGRFDTYGAAPRPHPAAQHAASPVWLYLHGIEVDLPPGLTHGQFEAALDRALLPLRLQTVADTDAGRALCVRAGAGAGADITGAASASWPRRRSRWCSRRSTSAPWADLRRHRDGCGPVIARLAAGPLSAVPATDGPAAAAGAAVRSGIPDAVWTVAAVAAARPARGGSFFELFEPEVARAEAGVLRCYLPDAVLATLRARAWRAF